VSTPQGLLDGQLAGLCLRQGEERALRGDGKRGYRDVSVSGRMQQAGAFQPAEEPVNFGLLQASQLETGLRIELAKELRERVGGGLPQQKDK